MKTFIAKDYYEQKTRDNGETFFSLKDDSPLHDILQDWIRLSHGSCLPNDFVYDMCIECLRDFEGCDLEQSEGYNRDEDNIREELQNAFADSTPSYGYLRTWIKEAKGDEWIDQGIDEGLLEFSSSDRNRSITDLFQSGHWFHRYTIASNFPISEILEYLSDENTEIDESVYI
jgi:hypothetical protein